MGLNARIDRAPFQASSGMLQTAKLSFQYSKTSILGFAHRGDVCVGSRVDPAKLNEQLAHEFAKTRRTSLFKNRADHWRGDKMI
jgi:non-ribosomal peptide synthetase component F